LSGGGISIDGSPSKTNHLVIIIIIIIIIVVVVVVVVVVVAVVIVLVISSVEDSVYRLGTKTYVHRVSMQHRLVNIISALFLETFHDVSP